MACRDGVSGGPDDEDLRKLEVRLNKVTRLLCALCRSLEGTAYANLVQSLEKGELGKWWLKHKKDDEKRVKEKIRKKKARRAEQKREEERAKVKAAALAKLSIEERAALGFRE